MTRLEDIQMVFILCMGRSGSTLLQTMFDSMDEISAPPESPFIIRLQSRYEKIKTWDDQTKTRFSKDVFFNRKLKNFWGIQQNDLLANLKIMEISSFSDACKCVYLTYHQRAKKTPLHIICDKNPIHSYYIEELLRIFPSAKFVHLIRDPRAVIASQKKAFNRNSIYDLCAKWIKNNGETLNAEKRHKNHFATVYYENLVKNPDQVFQELLYNLNIQYSFQEAVRIERLTQNPDYRKYLDLKPHATVLTPIDSAKINQWKNELSQAEILLIEDICADFAKSFTPYNLKSNGSAAPNLTAKAQAKFDRRTKLIKKLMRGPIWIKRCVQKSLALLLDRNKLRN